MPLRMLATVAACARPLCRRRRTDGAACDCLGGGSENQREEVRRDDGFGDLVRRPQVDQFEHRGCGLKT